MTRFTDETLRHEYKMQGGGYDEIALELGIDFDKVKLTPRMCWVGLQVQADECNHIFTNPRRDLRSNLINLSRHAHQAFHHDLRLGRMLCLLAKSRRAERTGDPREFNVRDIEICAGKSLAGWLDCQKFDSDLFNDMQLELIYRIGRAKEAA